jgi:hypothetical protein
MELVLGVNVYKHILKDIIVRPASHCGKIKDKRASKYKNWMKFPSI